MVWSEFNSKERCLSTLIEILSLKFWAAKRLWTKWNVSPTRSQLSGLIHLTLLGNLWFLWWTFETFIASFLWSAYSETAVTKDSFRCENEKWRKGKGGRKAEEKAKGKENTQFSHQQVQILVIWSLIPGYYWSQGYQNPLRHNETICLLLKFLLLIQDFLYGWYVKKQKDIKVRSFQIINWAFQFQAMFSESGEVLCSQNQENVTVVANFSSRKKKKKRPSANPVVLKH